MHAIPALQALSVFGEQTFDPELWVEGGQDGKLH